MQDLYDPGERKPLQHHLEGISPAASLTHGLSQLTTDDDIDETPYPDFSRRAASRARPAGPQAGGAKPAATGPANLVNIDALMQRLRAFGVVAAEDEEPVEVRCPCPAFAGVDAASCPPCQTGPQGLARSCCSHALLPA